MTMPIKHDDLTPAERADVDRYHVAMHAMQSGVAFTMPIDPKPTEPKHLRVGINAAMSDQAALAFLLIEKGVITRAEYIRAVADQAEREAAGYAEALSKHHGRPITLG